MLRNWDAFLQCPGRLSWTGFRQMFYIEPQRLAENKTHHYHGFILSLEDCKMAGIHNVDLS